MRQPVIDRPPGSLDVARSFLAHQSLIAVTLVTGIILLSVIFYAEIHAATDVWNVSTAYSHCYLIIPMSLYLLWERRSILRTVAARPDFKVALAALPTALAWLMAERLGFMEGRQLAAIAGVEVFLCTVLGRSLFWKLSGPLLFLFFLVPFGAFLTPVLQRFTAAFSIAGLDLVGIPNFSDRFTIETPAGIFFVAEACAGLRFLIAAIAFGVFYALLSYKSFARRAGFIVASIIVPIVANGFRALGIVILGQILGSAEAAAADHLIYGWLFFSFVMLLLIAGGQAFREDSSPANQLLPSIISVQRRSKPWGAFGAIFLLGLGPATAKLIESQSTAPDVKESYVFQTPMECMVTSMSGPAHQRLTTMNCNGTEFELRLNLFAVRSTSNALVTERRRVTQEIGAEDVTLLAADVPPSEGYWTIAQTTDPNRVSAYASWVDGKPVSSATAGRIAQARDSLFGGDYVAALITVTSAEPQRSVPAQRKAVFEQLVRLISSQTNLASDMELYTRLPKN